MLDMLTTLPAAGATLASFVLALLFFLGELIVFKTLGWRTALQPLIVAGARQHSLFTPPIACCHSLYLSSACSELATHHE